MKRQLTFLLLVTCLVSCRRPLPDGLIVLAGSKTTSSYSVRGMYRVEYQIQEKYPAAKSIQEISSQLEKKGWKPLSNYFVYPESQTSHVTGWIYYKDPPKAPTWMVYAWSSDWEDSNHNIVSYTFRYSDPIAKYNESVFVLKPDNKNLIITAIYMPAEAARKLRAEKQKKKMKS
jgi:hypothetical protein